MSRFDTYFLMKTPDVLEYVKEKGYMPADAQLTAKEIGDGNLNYVFRVVDEKTGKSVIVKQAGVSLRISADMKVWTDRLLGTRLTSSQRCVASPSTFTKSSVRL